MEDHPSVLIFAAPGRLRESYQFLLASSSQVRSVRLVDDLLSAPWLTLAEPPEVAILAWDPFGTETLTALEKIRQTWPQSRTVVLVDSEPEYQLAKSRGASVILMKGILAARLLNVIEDLLSE